MFENYVGAFFFSVVLLGTPGPAVITLFSSSIQYGLYKTTPLFTGIIIGFFINLLISSLFVGSSYYISDALFLVSKGVAALYMFYLAYKIAMSPVLTNDKLAKPMGFGHGIFLNLINPKAYIASFSSLSIFSVKTDFVMSIIILIIINMVLAITFQWAWVFTGEKLSLLFRNAFYSRIVNIVLAMLMIAVVVAGLML